ncbi:MAG: HAMP domain-containing sensor histidine kinase [Methanoregulaceae archaeon]|jgi:signal transduction histidine kinase
MKLVDFGKTVKEKDMLILLSMICLVVGILAADVLIPLGFVIWILYLVPLLMSVWLSYRYSPFFTTWVVSGAIVLGGIISNRIIVNTTDLLDRAIFIVNAAIVSVLLWEIQSNQANLQLEVAERRTAQEKLEDLTHTLEIRVTDRTRELSEVNEKLKDDVTQRKKAENALRQANKKLNILSSVTRHDILNKLTVLLAFLDLSKEKAEKNSVIFDYIGKELEITDAIQRQIEFTRFYQDVGVRAPEWQDVSVTIQKAVDLLRIKEITVNIEIKGLQVYADTLIERVFYNLMENSIRHGEHVTTISFSYHKTPDGVTIVYTDDGIGIPTVDKANIFIRGFGKHTGLGMFLSREILGITGITIFETGEPGKGVCFEINVPAEDSRIMRNAV